MNYLKYTQYVYLAFSGFFIYDAITKHNNGQSPWLSVIIAVVSILMFLFRRNYAKKFEKRNNNP